MYKYATIIGSASACKWMHDHMHKPLFGMLEKGANCPASDAPRMNHMQANRELWKALYQGSVKGLYQENNDVVSDECFGDWMDETWTIVHDLKKKAHEDSLWEIDMNEWKNAGARVINDLYKLNDVCKFEKVGDDMKHFCLENPGQCRYLEGLEDRLFDQMFEIMGVAFDFYKLFMKNDSCYTDKELMAEVYRASTDYGELMAYLYGVDTKWDQSVEAKHIKRSTFHKMFKDELKEDFGKMSHMDKLGLMFPDFVDLFKAIEEFFKDIEKQAIAMFKPHHHQHKQHITLPGEIKEKHHNDFFSQMFAPQKQQQDLFSSLFAPKQVHHNVKPAVAPESIPVVPHHQKMDPFAFMFPQHMQTEQKQSFNFFEQPIHVVRQWLA